MGSLLNILKGKSRQKWPIVFGWPYNPGPPGIPVQKSKNSPPPPYEIPENSRFSWRVPRGPQTLQKCGILIARQVWWGKKKKGNAKKVNAKQRIICNESPAPLYGSSRAFYGSNGTTQLSSGGSKLGPGGHRPPQILPRPPKFFQGYLGLTFPRVNRLW